MGIDGLSWDPWIGPLGGSERVALGAWQLAPNQCPPSPANAGLGGRLGHRVP